MLSNVFLQTNSTGNNPFILPELQFVVSIMTVTVTVGILLVTWRSMRRSNKLTQESNDLLRTELEARVKPVLIIENDNRGMHRADNSEKYRLFGEILNSGSVPARNVTLYDYIKDSEIKLDELVRHENEIKRSSRELGSIVQDHPLPFSSNKSFDIHAERDHQIAIWLEYDFLDEKKEEVIHIFEIEAGQMVSLAPNPKHSFYLHTYVDNDIKEAIQHWKDLQSGVSTAGF